DIRPHQPILSWPGWQTVLGETGFDDIVDLSASHEQMGNALLAARGPRLEIAASEPPWSPRNPPGCWLLFADHGNCAEILANGLAERGEHCLLVEFGTGYRRISSHLFEIAPDSCQDMETLFSELKASGLLPTDIVFFADMASSCALSATALT